MPSHYTWSDEFAFQALCDSYFTEECERLKSVFSKLKYPKHLVDSTVKTFLNLKVADHPSSWSRAMTENTTRVVIPFKDWESLNIVKTQLKDLSVKLQTIVQPVFMSCKIAQEFPTSKSKPQLIDQQCIVYNFKCDQCDAGYVGNTRGICSYTLMDIEARLCQCTNTMIIDMQATGRKNEIRPPIITTPIDK